jgi:hypothetical protein
MVPVPAPVEELAEFFAAHRVVPFIGTGCSLGRAFDVMRRRREKRSA